MNDKPQSTKPTQAAPPREEPRQSVHTQAGDFYCPHYYWLGPGFWQCYYCGHTEVAE